MTILRGFKSERKRLGLTQEAAANLVGISREMWGKYERGASPCADVLVAMQKAGFNINNILPQPKKLEDCLTLDGMMAATEKHAKYFFADLGFSESEVEMVVVMLKNHDQIPMIRFGKFTCLLPYDMPDGRERLLNKVCNTCGSTHKKLKEQA